MIEIGVDTERAPRGRRHEIVGVEQAALAMHLGAEPGHQRTEVTLSQSGPDVRHGGTGRLKKLRRRDGAQRVGRKIPPAAAWPVDVLQTALGVVRDGQAQQILHAGVEGGGQILDLQRPVDHCPFQVVAQQDVRGIGDLVRIDADEARGHPRKQAVEVFRIERRVGSRKGRLHLRREVAHELPGPAGLHLDQQRLAFVHHHATGVADRLLAPLLRPALLIEGVPRLVQHPHQSAGKVGFVVACRDPDIVRGAAAERMQAHVETAAIKVEAQRPHHRFAELTLRGHGKGARDGGRRAGLILKRASLLDQTREFAAEPVEERIDLRPTKAGIILVEQGIVGGDPERGALAAADLPLQPKHFFQVGQQQREIAGRPRLPPHHLGPRRRRGTRQHEVERYGGGMGVGAAHLTQVGRLPGIKRVLPPFGVVQRFGGAGRYEQIVGDAAQRRQLIRAALGGAMRHERLGVPA